MAKQEKSGINWWRVIFSLVGMVTMVMMLWRKYERLRKYIQERYGVDVNEKLQDLDTDAIKGEVEKHVKELVSVAVKKTASQIEPMVEEMKQQAEIKKQTSKPTNAAFQLSDRQEQIYQFIKQGGEANMPAISSLISGVTDRTLRRDMTKLEKLGLVRQVGKTRNSVYKTRD